MADMGNDIENNRQNNRQNNIENKNKEKKETEFTGDFATDQKTLGAMLGRGVSYDIIYREIPIAGSMMCLYLIEGFSNSEVLTYIMQELQHLPAHLPQAKSIFQYVKEHINYFEVEDCHSLEEAAEAVLSGQTAMILGGSPTAFILDTRQFAARGPSEPDLERVIRGSRDGFTETIIFNTQLVRRRIRDGNLRMEMVRVGRRSQTDVCISYIHGVANPHLVGQIKERLAAVNIDGLPMAEKSLEELITPGNVWNPLPRVRYTERPDVASQRLLEGHIVVMVDTSPSVMVLPATYFYHWVHAEEYRQAPLVGLYLRWVRYLAILTSVLLLPLWYAGALERGVGADTSLPLTLQVILAELVVDVIRLAAIHTPTALSTSLGLIATLMVGNIGIDLNIFSREAVMYTAIAATTLFATPSYELGMAHRLGRWVLLFGAFAAGYWGVGIGFLLLFFFAYRTQSFGEPYLWPLLPWNGAALKEMLLRPPVPQQLFRPSIVHPLNKRRQGSEKMPEFHSLEDSVKKKKSPK